MAHRTRVLAAAAAALLAAACSGSGGSTGPSNDGKTALAVSASKPTIPADGSSFVVIHAEGGAPGTLTVTTTKGAFAGGATSLTMDATPFDLELQTCDSRLDTACAGLASVTVLDKALTRRGVSVTLAQLEICGNGRDDDGNGKADCADTAACPQGTPCTAHGMSCGADASCSVCSGNGGTPEVKETSCGDGFDHDGDGLVDCADPDCGSKVCQGAVSTAGGLTTGTCVTATKSCVCKPTAEVCNDGIDNDCDGKIDCDDPDCQPVGNNLGKVCDAVGHTCSPPGMTGGKSVCGVVCSGNGGTPQPAGAETNCFDGFDNDCNGLTDCQDPNCAALGLQCSTTGKTCGDDFQCVCRKAEATTGETSCGNGADDDCDGFIDCKDSDCQNAKADCAPNGFKCTAASGGTCACSGNGGVAQSPKETSCADGFDNDCDGAADCMDVDCRPATAGGYGQGCTPAGGNPATAPTFGFKCDFLGKCVCSKGQTNEVSCGDGVDNDCDGLVDCADPDCQPLGSGMLGQACTSTGLTCGSGGQCNVCSGNGGNPEPNEASCYDGFDNDCDGKVDCADSDCLNKQCAASPNYKCTLVQNGGVTSAACLDTSSAYVLTVTSAASRLAADGVAGTTITAKLSKRDTTTGALQAVPAMPVSFAVTGNGAITPNGTTTDSTGTITATFTSSSLGGTAVVTASYDTGTQVITGSVNVDQPAVALVKLVSTQYKVMGARYSGFQETNVITFQLFDNMNVPYPPDLQVDFTHQAAGGSYIGSAEVCDDGPPRVCTASAKTDAQGYVRVTLHSGKTLSAVAVTATASAGGAVVAGNADQLAVVGAKASGSHISILCTPSNVPGFTQHDCINSKYGGQDNQITCTVALADRFNNVLGVSTLATFISEAGAAGPPATTPAYDPTKPPTAQTGLGRAQDYVAVTGYKLPVDVAPFDGEYPRRWDAVLKQYVDDPGGTFNDGMGCGIRTHNPRDGLSTILVLAIGEEGFVDGSNGCPADGQYQGPNNGVCTGIGAPIGENFIDIGEPFIDANDNGIRDADEDYVDANTNGKWDPPNGVWDEKTVIWAETRVLYSGLPYAGVTSDGRERDSRFYRSANTPLPPQPTPTEWFTTYLKNDALDLPARPDFLNFYVADANFNPPTPRTTYTLTATGEVSAKWDLPPSTSDTLGAGFSQLYCSTQTPSDISTQCDAVTCRYAPCYVVTNVTSFGYGRGGSVRIDPKANPDLSSRVNVTATFNGVGALIAAPGTVTTQP